MTGPPSVVVYYLDASALVKRYTTETGSGWITALCQPDTGTLIATYSLRIKISKGRDKRAPDLILHKAERSKRGKRPRPYCGR